MSAATMISSPKSCGYQFGSIQFDYRTVVKSDWFVIYGSDVAQLGGLKEHLIPLETKVDAGVDCILVCD